MSPYCLFFFALSPRHKSLHKGIEVSTTTPDLGTPVLTLHLLFSTQSIYNFPFIHSSQYTAPRPRIMPPKPKHSMRTTRAHSKSALSDSDGDEGATCLLCKIELQEHCQAMKCEICCKWVCKTCTKLDDAEYGMISKMKDLHWYYVESEESTVQAVQNDAMIEERCQECLTKFEDRLNKLEKTLELKADKFVVDNLDTKLLRLEGIIANLADDISKLNGKVDSVDSREKQMQKQRDHQRSSRRWCTPRRRPCETCPGWHRLQGRVNYGDHKTR